jgi:hypothetical protein
MATPSHTALTIVTKQPTFGSFISPRGEINGYPVGLRWGSNTIGAHPGLHHIKIHMPWLWKFGEAELTVDNTAGPAPTVYYSAPWVNFGRGAIGLTPMPNPGLGIFIAVLVVPLLLIAACCVGAALLGN